MEKVTNGCDSFFATDIHKVITTVAWLFEFIKNCWFQFFNCCRIREPSILVLWERLGFKEPSVLVLWKRLGIKELSVLLISKA
jgi:hypothetical protein